jgi:hypothetical protein
MLAVVLVAGCERLGLGPESAKSSPAAPAAEAPEVRGHAGESLQEFLSQPEMERYQLEALGLTAGEAARFEASMSPATPGELVSGGGAEALAFTGCAAAGCDEGVAILAVDAATGAAFVGVRDEQGADVLMPNPRIEALLRLSSASGQWHDPARERVAAAQ